MVGKRRLLLDQRQARGRRTNLHQKSSLFALLRLSSKFLKDLLVVLVSVESIVDISSDKPPLLAEGEEFSLRNGMFGRAGLVIVDVLASDDGTVDMHIII